MKVLDGGTGPALSEGKGGGGGGGGGCARSVGGEGGGGGGDSLRVLLIRFEELPCLLLVSPFCPSSFSSLWFAASWFGSSSRFFEKDLRGNGGGSRTRLCCSTTCTC